MIFYFSVLTLIVTLFSYALKEINIKSMTQRERFFLIYFFIIQSSSCCRYYREDSMNEIRILASFRHPNITRYREAFIENDKLYIVSLFLVIY